MAVCSLGTGLLCVNDECMWLSSHICYDALTLGVWLRSRFVVLKTSISDLGTDLFCVDDERWYDCYELMRRMDLLYVDHDGMTVL